MTHAYEFEIYPDGDGWYVAEPFDMEGATEGHGYGEAEFMAADWLRTVMEDAAINQRPYPPATYGHHPEHEGGRVVCFAVNVERDGIARVTASEAARRLGVSPGRITQMLDAGHLEGWREGHRTWVTLDSLRARMGDRRAPGRPKGDGERTAVRLPCA